MSPCMTSLRCNFLGTLHSILRGYICLVAFIMEGLVTLMNVYCFVHECTKVLDEAFM